MAGLQNLSELNNSSLSDESLSNRSLNRSQRIVERERRKNEADDPFVLAVKYFADVEAGTPMMGNDDLERNLVVLERAAYAQGLPPDAISVMLEFAMSLRMGASLCPRVLKFLIPATVVPQEAVVRAVAWLCCSNIPTNTQLLFIKWVLTVFDMIDAKDQLRAVYGFIFSFVTDEKLCPFVCHLLYLLTTKQNVRVFRVRKLLDLVTKLGRKPFLLHLLCLYKVFLPELVTLSISSKMRYGFRNHNAPWKSALALVQKRNSALMAASAGLSLTIKDQNKPRKRKHHHLELPMLSCALTKESQTELSSIRKLVPLAQIRSFAELLEDMHRIELPAQMGSMLSSSVTLHYLDCIQDESAFLRLNFWLSHALQEEFLFCRDGDATRNSDDAVEFLQRLQSTQHFLQDGFSSCERFLFKFLTVWDGAFMRSEILSLLSHIPVVPSDRIRELLLEPLTKLYFTSSVFFKCGLLDVLNSMLRNWLIWHSVYTLDDDDLDISISNHVSVYMTLSGYKDSVSQLVQFVAHLAAVGLQLESCNLLLLNFILDFYETVCDIFLKFGLPLIIMPPPGVFYPALLSADPVSVDQLAYIMHRYKVNLEFAKSQMKITKAFHINSQTLSEFNHYVVDLVNFLWNGKTFQSKAYLQLDEDLLQRSKVPECSSSFNFVHHPAFIGYAIDFHRKCWPDKDLDLNAIKQVRPWGWYMEYLFSQGFNGLQLFSLTVIRRPASEGDKERSGTLQPS
ncbi:centromere protein I [Vanacampus margaritifer]